MSIPKFVLGDVAEAHCPECQQLLIGAEENPEPALLECPDCKLVMNRAEVREALRAEIQKLIDCAEDYELPNPLWDMDS